MIFNQQRRYQYQHQQRQGRELGRKQTMLVSFGCLIITMFLLGAWSCQQGSNDTPTSVAMSARDSIASASAFVGNSQKLHPECIASVGNPNAPQISPTCTLIQRGKASVNLAVDALNQYCASTNYNNGGPCVPDPSLQNQLQQALSNVNQVVTDLKAVK
jgi:hypothetical protein